MSRVNIHFRSTVATSLLALTLVWLLVLYHVPVALAQAPDKADQPLSHEQLFFQQLREASC